MGMQIGLYRVDDFDKMFAFYEDQVKRFEKWRKKEKHIDLGMVVDLFPPYQGELKISISHPKYPSHPFNIGNIHMPYGGGIFSVLQSGITGVNYVFEREPGISRFRPDWDASLIRVNKLMEVQSYILKGCTLKLERGDSVFYAEAIEILADTIKHVLEQKDVHLYYLFWDE